MTGGRRGGSEVWGRGSSASSSIFSIVSLGGGLSSLSDFLWAFADPPSTFCFLTSGSSSFASLPLSFSRPFPLS